MKYVIHTLYCVAVLISLITTDHCTHLHNRGFFILVIPFKTHRNWENNPYAFWYVLLQLVYLVYSRQADSARLSHADDPHPETHGRGRDAVRVLLRQGSYVRRGELQVYSSIPFLYEINTIMEWMTTKTVLRMDMWLTAEEIHHVPLRRAVQRGAARAA